MIAFDYDFTSDRVKQIAENGMTKEDELKYLDSFLLPEEKDAINYHRQRLLNSARVNGSKGKISTIVYENMFDITSDSRVENVLKYFKLQGFKVDCLNPDAICRAYEVSVE